MKLSGGWQSVTQPESASEMQKGADGGPPHRRSTSLQERGHGGRVTASALPESIINSGKHTISAKPIYPRAYLWLSVYEYKGIIYGIYRMPSVAKSTNWFIRITAPWEHIESKIDEIRGWLDYDTMIIGLHYGEKREAPHGHICLKLKSNLQKQSVDSRFKKLYDVKGSQYSSKVWDGDIKCMSYLYHDKKGKVINHMNLSDLQIQELKELNNQIQKVVEENKGRASHKVVDYVLKQANSGWSRYDIGDCILRAVAQGEFYDPGDFALERYINEIELKLNVGDKDALDQVITSRLNRLSSFRRNNF